MRHRTRTSASAAIVLMTAFTIARAQAATSTAPENGGLLRPSPMFAVSGEFTGILAGEIVLDGTTYRLAPNALLYEIGQGLLPVGTTVTDRRVFLSGRKRRDAPMVYTVIVRPAEATESNSGDPSSHVRVRDASSPQ